MPIIATAAAGGLNVAGGLMSKSAANKAAAAQRDIAEKALQFAKEDMERQRGDRIAAYETMARVAQPTADEMAALNRLVQNNDTTFNEQLNQLNKLQESLASAPDIIKEAGQQQLNILKGETAAVLGPVNNQRQKARMELEQRLADRFGPGYKTTAAGIMALNNFDDQTSLITNQVQQEALGRLGAIQGEQAGLIGGAVAQKEGVLARRESERFNQAQAVLQAQQVIQNRRLAATSQLGQAISGAGVSQAFGTLGNVIGNQFAGQIGFGRSISNLGSNLGQTYIQQDQFNRSFNQQQEQNQYMRDLFRNQGQTWGGPSSGQSTIG